MERSGKTRKYRKAVALDLSRQPRPPLPLARARISVGGFFCRLKPRPPNPAAYLYDKKVMRPTDPWNFAAGIKSLIDALQPERHDGGGHHYGAGIIAGDDNKHSEMGRIWIRDVGSFREEGVVIIVTELL